MNNTLDMKGLALIERFLDEIEENDEEILVKFQNNFNEIIQKHQSRVGDGSAEYQSNQEKIISFQNSKDAPVKIGKNTSDGFENCVYKGCLDDDDQPHGEGTLQYSLTESFSGTFDHSIRHRTGARFFSGGDVAKIEGSWRHGFLEGLVSVEYTTGGYHEAYYHHGVLHGFYREFGIGGYLKEFR